MLRPEFGKLREYSLQRRNRAQLHQVLVFMAGIDKDNITAQVLEALKFSALPDDCMITVVMGQNAPWLDTVQEQSQNLPWCVNMLINIDNIAQYMADCDLAIGAAGTTSWERCCLGLPSIVVALADNQKTGARNLVEAGAAMTLPVSEITIGLPQMLLGLMQNPAQQLLISKRSSQLTNGNGLSYLVSCLCNALRDNAAP